MPVCRLIHRLDFKANFEILDNPGYILRKLDSTTLGSDKIKFFDAVGERIVERLIEANSIDIENKEWSRRIVIKPDSIDFNIENASGLSIDRLGEDSSLNKMFSLINEFRDKFEISDLKRAGVRLLYFTQFDSEVENILKVTKKIMGPCFIGPIEKNLGSIKDIGITFDGDSDDKIKYHFRFGPYWPDEYKMKGYLSLNIDKPGNSFNFIMDIDLYETDFNLNTKVSIKKWINSQLENSQKLITGITNALETEINTQKNQDKQ